MGIQLIGQSAPDIEFLSTSTAIKRFNDLSGQFIVVYFYPKDHTSGCTREAEDFRDYYAEFQKLNTCIIGVSRDSLSSHHKFIEKLQLPFNLISDPKEILCEYFQVIVDKKMYGKSVKGIERSTFLINPQGIFQREWRKVKVPGHVMEVLNSIDIKANSHERP